MGCFFELLFQEEKLAFFLVLERDLGVDHEEVIRVTGSLVSAQVSSECWRMWLEECFLWIVL